ncbi:multicopper oxidase family protein [Mycetocola sp.]|uniref:multicopper oxidase family protein n=1 Tax=Mycetocola sp. TaxID=1871042 RepID=UPI0039894033
MEPISRRGALTLGGLGLVGIAVGGVGLLWSSSSARTAQPLAGEKLREPPELRSANGRLQLRLDAAQGTVEIGGRSATAWSFNRGIPGPTLRLKAGDWLGLTLHNGLDKPTNLHVHGLHVSPEGNGDNPFVMVEPGETFDYEYQLPADHPPGVFWYHPHHHGFAADQIFGGLYGAIIVEDPETIEAVRERVLVISDITVDGQGHIPSVSPMEQMMGREGELVLVNGQVNPRLSARPSERERWRIVNACVSRYLRLQLDGQRMQLLGIDSGRFATPRTVEDIVLTPGNRADLLVTMVDGTAVLETQPYNRGSAGAIMGGNEQPRSGTAAGRARLATLTVTGESVAAVPEVPVQPTPRDLRGSAVTARRELTLAMGMGGMGSGGLMSFTINGQEFDGERVDIMVEAGSVEEWTLTNTSSMDHPLHLHVWPMQVVGADVGGSDPAIWRDVVNVPARDQVRVRIAFDDFKGRSVYHCHILDHEDNGMMGVIEAR